MNLSAEITMFLTMFLFQAPTLIVCLVAIVVILVRGQLAPQATLWAMIAFGLTLILSIVVPAVQTLIQHWVFQSSGDFKSRNWAFQVSGGFWAIVHALVYICFLIAICAGRQKPDSTNSETVRRL